MSSPIASALGPLESGDPYLQRAFGSVLSLLEQTDLAEQMADVQLYLADYRYAPPGVRRSHYYTENCAALLNERAILVNEAYLLETEAAIRSFGLAGDLFSIPYFRSDEDLFGLVGRVRADPHKYVGRLRSLDSLPGRDSAHAEVLDSYAMLITFLVGHELGHLQGRHDQRAFGTFVDPAAPLETRVGNAVVKLARHARELSRLGFGLPGFEDAISESSEVGRNQEQWRDKLGDIQLNHERWFADESHADEYAVALVQHILDCVAATEPERSDRLLALAVDALFAAALYHWQRDLAEFLRKVGIRSLSNAQDLAFNMLQKRERYIEAGALFGDVHRFTLLRAIMAIDGWLHARGVFEDPIDTPVRRVNRPPARAPLDSSTAHACVLRKTLLQIHLDTAVKIATVGSATGWILEADKARGQPQLLMIRFETIRDSVDRLRRML